MKTVDLFEDLIPEEKQHQNYRAIKEDQYAKAVINSWTDEKLLKRDGEEKFVKEFQSEFNSSLWEMYIYQCLKKVGCNFNLKYVHPDYVVSLPSQDFLVECTIANNAKGDIPEYDITAKCNDSESIDNMVYKQAIRLSNSFLSKYKKYTEKYVKEKWTQIKPYIIAIAPFEQPNGFKVGNEAILVTLYGELFNRYERKYHQVEGLIKENNAKITLGYFKNPDFKEVAAVLFSTTATMGKVDALGDNPYCIFEHYRIDKNGCVPKRIVSSRINIDGNELEEIEENQNMEYGFYRETITDGMFCYINPFAEYPLNQKTILALYNAGINIYYYDLKEQDFTELLVHDGSLVHRFVLKIKPTFT